LRSPAIGIIGVGEGTFPTVPKYLHGYLNIPPREFYREVQPTWKLGGRFLWGPRSHFHYTFKPQLDLRYQILPKPMGFYYDHAADYGDLASALMAEDRVFARGPDGAPRIGTDIAYHLENEKLVAYLEKRAHRQGVAIVDATVGQVEQDENGITGLRLEDGSVQRADLFVDCSGFRSSLLGQALGEPFLSYKSTLFCDRAVVGGWTRRPDEPIKPYTTFETMDSGWCWQIEHEHSIARGYVYSSDFVSDQEAETEFRQKNPGVGQTRVVRFTSGRYRRGWVKNAVAIGNAAGFVEPLEATALITICIQCQLVAENLLDAGQRYYPTQRQAYNRHSDRLWDTIRQFLAVHYKFNTRLQTPFWQACQHDIDMAGAEEMVDFFRENGPSTMWGKTLIDPFDPFELDGYLTMLVGQQVAYRRPYTPTDAELSDLKRIKDLNRRQAQGAFGCQEAMAYIRSPQWQWPRDLYDLKGTKNPLA
jgi:tryptophan 7-halogenase